MNQPPDVRPIVEFLRARLDEDRALAEAAGGDDWRLQDHPSDTGAVYDSKGEPVVYDEGSPTEEQSAHIARHDPDRVLRQTSVLRGRVDLWSKMAGSHARACLRDLAAIWVDHPDYRPEWKL